MLVGAFGTEVFEIIENEPNRLSELHGIGLMRQQRITERWREQRVVRQIMIFLHEHGLGTARAVRVYKTYFSDALVGVGIGGDTAQGSPSMDNDQALREHLLHLLRGGGAHLDFDTAIANLPVGLRGAKPDGVPHTPWRLVEHMRIAQWDILEFCRNSEHVSPKLPDGYWPDGNDPPASGAWDRSVGSFRADLRAMQDLVADSCTDLLARIPHGDGQTILQEALLVADHNSYHLGQLIVVRRLLGAWPADR